MTEYYSPIAGVRISIERDARALPMLVVGQRFRNEPGGAIWHVMRVTDCSATVQGSIWREPFMALDKRSKTGAMKLVPGRWVRERTEISPHSLVYPVGADEPDRVPDEAGDSDGEQSSPTSDPNAYEGKRGRHPFNCACSKHGSVRDDSGADDDSSSDSAEPEADATAD